MENTAKNVIPHPSLHSITIDRAVESYLLMSTAEGQSRNTINLSRYVFDSFRRWYERDDLQGITPYIIRSYLAYLAGERKYRPHSVHVYFRVLRTFFNFLLREGMIDESPMMNMKPPKLPKSFPFVLSDFQVQALLKAPNKSTWTGLRNHTILLTFLDTGLRLSELVNLELKDLDLAGRSIRVTGKGEKTRDVYIGKKLQKALSGWLRVRGYMPYEEAVFPTRQGERLNGRNLYHIIVKLGRKAGITGVRCSPHTLRHTFATNYIRNGGDPFSLQQLLGHSDIKTCMIYVHMAGVALREAHAKFSPVDRMMG